MQTLEFLPNPPLSWKRVALTLLSFWCLILWGMLDSMIEFVVFSVFSAMFVVLMLVLNHYGSIDDGFPLKFDEKGLHHEPFNRRYGVAFVPWSEVQSMDIFIGGGTPGTRAPWLRVRLKRSAFHKQLKRPVAEGIFGSDVNVLLDFDVEAEQILKYAKQFLAEYGG